MKPENTILETKVKDWLKKQCKRVLDVTPVPIIGHGYGGGIPDYMIPYFGTHLVEVKRPVNGKLSNAQHELIKAFNRSSTLIWVLHDCETVDAFINYLIAVYGTRL